MTSTLVRMFWDRVESNGPLDAQLAKRHGRWERATWSDVGTAVREAALGFLALGRERGDAVALLSGSRAEWVQADFAIQSAGCVTVPIYPTYTPEQIARLVADSGARAIVVETPAHLAAALEARSRLTAVQHIIVLEEAEDSPPAVWSWAGLRRLGREHGARLASALVERVTSLGADDVATIVYTSGTTGEPKGVIQTHGNHLATLRALAQIPDVEAGDVHLLFLPLAHSFARMEAFVGVHRRLVTAFAESLRALPDNLREVRPHVVFGVPRVFEKARERILLEVAAGGRARRALFEGAIGVGTAVSRRRQARRPLPRGLELRRRLAERAVFARVRAGFGGRLRFAVSGGAPLDDAVAEFFHAVGLPILEGYGLTESCPALTFNRLDAFKVGSVGQAIAGVELRIAPDGEILARGPNVATRGYWHQPGATAETFDVDGWLHTGDVGRLDDEGFLFITGRKKELIVTSGGMNIAPQHIEGLLERHGLVSQAVVYGDRRPYPTALITLDAAAVERFARAHGLLADRTTLARHPAILEEVARTVGAANSVLAPYARIKRYTVLPGELTETAGELTPTQKVKRAIVAERYRDQLEALYR